MKSLLDERGVEYVERHYLEEALDASELAELSELLDRPVREWVRSKETPYAELGLHAGASDADHFAAMVKQPILMERPIVVHGGAARVGRPPTDVLQLFDDD